jgi:hypothetical protein
MLRRENNDNNDDPNSTKRSTSKPVDRSIPSNQRGGGRLDDDILTQQHEHVDKGNKQRSASPIRELRRPYEVQTPTKYRKPLQLHSKSTFTTKPKIAIPMTESSTTTVPYSTVAPQSTAVQASAVEVGETSEKAEENSMIIAMGSQTTLNDKEVSRPATLPSSATSTQMKRHHNITKKGSMTQRQTRELQRAMDLPSVTVRFVNVTQRSAFLHYSLSPILRQIEAKHKQHPHTGKNRISPSLTHMQILHRIYNTHIIRQIQFSPSTSIDADYHYQIQQQQHDRCQNNQESKSGSGTMLPPTTKRDGRYRSIDPTDVKYMFRNIDSSKYNNDNLPPAPQFSYRKYRLPNRADVGFGQCTDMEIQTKQYDIRNETIWEEAQIRIAFVVSSVDFVTDTVDDDDDKPEQRSKDGGKESSEIIERYMPYAGRYLRSVMTKKRRRNSNGAGLSTDAYSPPIVAPNPYSMLAPPLESTYSPSQGWRPRAFHDRPTGLQYCYVSPMKVTLWPNKQEKNNTTRIVHRNRVVGSLALYTLPPLSKKLIGLSSGLVTAAAAATYHCQRNHTQPAYGKISEEFYFPIVSSEIQSTTDTSNLDRKAIFSYIPNDLVMEGITKSSRTTGPNSLYIVIRVYEVIQIVDNDAANQIGPIMKHVAFGITKLFSDIEMNWPDGQLKSLQLYSYPVETESQSMFVERLWRIVHQKSCVTSIISLDQLYMDDTLSYAVSVDDLGKKKSRGDRLFHSPPASRQNQHNRSVSVNAIDANGARNHLSFVTSTCGTAQLFLSSLNVDFLQCLLPSTSNTAASTTSQSPFQIIDVTGDFVVSADLNKEIGASGAEVSIGKRSNLVRLPQHVERAGYTGSSGCHEVLYLPARPDRQYHVDNQMAISRSILNFLYIYPRLIRLSPSHTGSAMSKGCCFTLRIQILKVDGTADGHASVSIRSFYDRAAWGGSSLASNVCTTIVESKKSHDMEVGLSIQDEIRIRLPEVLDGHHVVEFSLLSYQSGNDAMQSLTLLATASIPLTSTCTRSTDSVSNFRVATIIPNGKHRLELGEFQLHFETRILSSIHTTDPFVAANLRDISAVHLPATVDLSDVLINRSCSSTSVPTISDIASQLISSTPSMSAVAAFFQVMVYISLRRLVESISANSSDTTDSLRNLYLVIAKLKSYLLPKTGLIGGTGDSLGQYLRSYIDLFDESCLYQAVPTTPSNELENGSDETKEPQIFVSNGLNDDGFEIDFADDENEDPSKHLENSHRMRFYWRWRKSRAKAYLGTDSVPFSRVPFDVSKNDHWKGYNPRIQTESRHERGQVTAFYDDDVTIATAPSIYSSGHCVDARTLASTSSIQGNMHSDASATMLHSFDDNSIIPKESSVQRPIGGTEFVRRVRTAAAIMIAPCVTPSLTSVLKSPQETTVVMKHSFLPGGKDGESNVFARTVRFCL